MKKIAVFILFVSLGLWPVATKAAVRAAAPVSISIPRLGVNAMIDPRGLNSRGMMQPPSGAGRVSWYTKSAVPGSPGDAVMYGHLTGNSFQPAIFSRLNKLRKGDRIVVTDANRNVHTFQVKKLEAWKYDQMTYEQLAGKTRFIHLNVYTCAGRWDSRLRHYTHFLVVYTDLVSSRRGR